MKITFGIVVFFLIQSAAIGQTELTADEIVNRCIKAHGGKTYDNCSFEYDFRDKHYSYTYRKGAFTYLRSFTDTSGNDIIDVLSNDGFNRRVNGKGVSLNPQKANSYKNALNSVQYFAFLPYFLNDKAVNKSSLRETSIEGKSYYKIRVSFDQEGGGDDYKDIHVYWINKNSFTMDYLAYSFEENGGGVRFRKAYNPRRIGGVQFQDYINFKYDAGTPVENLDALYIEDKLIQLSLIELKNVKQK